MIVVAGSLAICCKVGQSDRTQLVFGFRRVGTTFPQLLFSSHSYYYNTGPPIAAQPPQFPTPSQYYPYFSSSADKPPNFHTDYHSYMQSIFKSYKNCFDVFEVTVILGRYGNESI